MQHGPLRWAKGPLLSVGPGSGLVVEDSADSLPTALDTYG